MTRAHVIAIVDDDSAIRRALHRLLEANGYTVESFASARDFLDASTRRRPACLVLDVHLNGSGFELQERLAADGMKIPIIFITAHDDDSTRRRVEQSRRCRAPLEARGQACVTSRNPSCTQARRQPRARRDLRHYTR